MNEKGHLGDGKRVHLISERADLFVGYAPCGAGGRLFETNDPVDCKVCLRYIAKRALKDKDGKDVTKT